MARRSFAVGAAAALVALVSSQSGLASTVTYGDDRAGFLAATGASSIGALPVTASLSGANSVAGLLHAQLSAAHDHTVGALMGWIDTIVLRL